MMVSCMVPMMDETLTVWPLLLTEKSGVSGRGGEEEELELRRLETAKARMKLQQHRHKTQADNVRQATSEWVNSQQLARRQEESGTAISQHTRPMDGHG